MSIVKLYDDLKNFLQFLCSTCTEYITKYIYEREFSIQPILLLSILVNLGYVSEVRNLLICLDKLLATYTGMPKSDENMRLGMK